MIINWQTGNQQWAYKHLAGHVIRALPQIQHRENASGDISVLLAWDQLLMPGVLDGGPVVLHLDGHRWMKR